MRCKACNSYIDNGMVFCPVCGAQVVPEDNASNYENNQPVRNASGNAAGSAFGINQFTNGIRCPGCGYTNQPGSMYCGGCGMPLMQNFPKPEPPKKKLSGGVIALICIGAVALIGCAVVALIIFGPFGSDGGAKEIATETTVTESPTSVPTDVPTEPPARRTTPAPDHNYNTGNEYVPSNDYSTKTDSAHSFSCDYPSDFSSIVPQADHKWVTYAFAAPDGTGYIYIGGAGGKTAEKTASDFINTEGNSGTVLINEHVDGSYCRIKTQNSSGYHYAYFILTNNQLRGFEVHYDPDQDQRYSKYISHMENTLYCY